MSRPFDETRYKGLSEGLEIAEVTLGSILGESQTKRIDPEYFNRIALRAQALIKSSQKLGDLVADGYRVVYENTIAVEREEGIARGLPFFLQASDISTPFINAESMICVDESEWQRYPRGRIEPGELLIEVKGRAEKLAIVPDDFPRKTLVTGTCFKLKTKNPADRYFLVSYLTSCYGQALKDRLKTNLLVSYLAKDDLYGLVIPPASDRFKDAIQKLFESCFVAQHQGAAILGRADALLTRTLGLETWQAPDPLTYVGSRRGAFAAGRLDAEYQRPRYEALQAELSSRFAVTSLASLGEITKGVTVEYFDDGSIPVIRSGDLGNIENTDAFLRTDPSEPVFLLQKGDVLISSIGFGSIGKVQVFDKDGAFGTVSEVTVIRQKQINPYYLAAFFRAKAGQSQIERHITGATGQLHLYPSDVAKFWVPVLPQAQQAEFETLAKQAAAARKKAVQLLNAARRAVEISIEESEAAAFSWLNKELAEHFAGMTGLNQVPLRLD